MMMKPRIPDPTPVGEMLEEEFLLPLGMTQSELARRLGCAPRVVNEICRGKRGISAVMALKLGHVFKNSPEFWMNLQQANDLWKAWCDHKETKRAV
jgi:addiction module HigA family antidote